MIEELVKILILDKKKSLFVIELTLQSVLKIETIIKNIIASIIT